MIPPEIFTEVGHTIDDIPGSIVEIGVYRGCSALQLCERFPDRTVHLFDTFCGMPAALIQQVDGHKAGDFDGTSVSLVQDVLSGHSYQIYEGVFPATAAEYSGGTVALAHIDCDLYQSNVDAIKWVWPILAVGGVLLNDDYNSGRCAGATQAMDEFAARAKVALVCNKTRAYAVKKTEACYAY